MNKIMSNKQWFVIDDLDKLVESIRVLVFNNFGKDKTNEEDETIGSGDELDLLISNLSMEELTEINTILTQKECLIIAKNMVRIQKNKANKKTRYIISEDKIMEMIECFNSRMVSNILHNLVSKEVLDSAYDENIDDFVFWIKDDENQKEKKRKTD